MSFNSNLIALQICIQARVPVFIWADPGRGKTAVVNAVAKALGEPLWTVIVQHQEPTEICGWPKTNSDKGYVDRVPPRWAFELVGIGHGIIFFDEFSYGNYDQQNATLTVVQSRVIGDLRLPDATSFVAVGNDPARVRSARHLTSASANRYVHLGWPEARARYREGMISGWPLPPIVPLPKGWQSLIPKMRSLVADFTTSKRPELLNAMPADTAAQGRAWPSERTWENSAIVLAASEACGHGIRSEVASILVRGCVGDSPITGEDGTEHPSAADEFFTYVVNLDLLDPEEYIANPMGPALPVRQDQTTAILTSVVAAALDQSRTDKQQLERFYAAWKFVGRICQAQGQDIAVMPARALARAMNDAAHSRGHVALKPATTRLPKEMLELGDIVDMANLDFQSQDR